MSVDRDELRAMVREVVRDAVASLKAPEPGPPVPTAMAPAPPASVAEAMGVEPTGPRASDSKNRTETVRLSDDVELDGFVRKLLQLFENPKNRADLKAGRLRFRLASKATGSASAGPVHRVDSGAVTERYLADLAGGTLILGRRAVLTPLAREKARSLGITITKERT
ncbi:hypothetical protein O6072_21995 [Mycolicibacterium neoaurum]|uniref:hypothetical protein n=1 Tax=Mycolicibacterium neoaurum TaxID=1795 RepID=UPI00248AE791|nr:hypothetical protein [Mycolicibacterium neoaurum]WBP93740.1 hypothetical protein O7W24_21795 [Mycolicibacterium neoaurum]WBS07483.1 hypothetical protein O6072_21995 [Mycolicibacterium neoaurum]